MTNLVQVTSVNFEQTISNNEIVVLDFWAQWCQPCLAFTPVFEGLAQRYPDITFGKINVEEEAELANEFAIRSIPTLMIFRQKIMLFNESGVLPATAVEDLLTQAKALNMQEVLRKLKEQHL
jgi:thioredoxin 1